jgi:Tfp pilus assembly protein FimT
MKARPPKQNSAFSLVEILAVITLIALVTSISVPAFHSIGGSRNMTAGIYEVSGLLEFARNEAMTRQTYVWVGFHQATNAGSLEILVSAVYSKDGSGSNTDPDNLQPVSRTLRIRNASLVAWNDLKTSTRALFPNAVPSSVAANASAVEFSSGQAQFAGKTITFSPRGEAMLAGAVTEDTALEPSIDVSFRHARGTLVLPEANDASVLLDGATGKGTVVRLQ